MADYHMSIKQALQFPVSAALALWPALSARHGWSREEGPDFTAQAAIAARREVREHLQANYRIID